MNIISEYVGASIPYLDLMATTQGLHSSLSLAELAFQKPLLQIKNENSKFESCSAQKCPRL